MKNRYYKHRKIGIFTINKILEHKIDTRCQFEVKLTALLQGIFYPGITYFSIQRLIKKKSRSIYVTL